MQHTYNRKLEDTKSTAWMPLLKLAKRVRFAPTHQSLPSIILSKSMQRSSMLFKRSVCLTDYSQHEGSIQNTISNTLAERLCLLACYGISFLSLLTIQIGWLYYKVKILRHFHT